MSTVDNNASMMVVVLSQELDELLAISDRIAVIAGGRLSPAEPAETVTAESLGLLMAGGAALGWSARDVLPDIIAGLVITFERRIRKGMWVRGEGFSGSVEQLGLRASWLRDQLDQLGVASHRWIDIDLRSLGGSALTDAIDVPKDRDGDEMTHGIPVTYVPARNTVFLSYALAVAEVIGSDDVFIGVNAVDYSGYPDCRGEYIRAFETMANLATKAGVEGQKITIHTPLMEMGKGDIIRAGIELGVDYALTVSCYQVTEDGRACGKCDSCRLRRQGFEDAGVADPTRYL